MCHITPDHVGIITGFVWLTLGSAVVSVLSGHTYFKRVIVRSEEPASFWSATLCLLGLGGTCLYGLRTCPIY